MGLLDVNGVKKSFADNLLFSDISFTLNPSDRLAIIGRNGCGKTTLLKMILGEECIDEGSIHVSARTSIGYLSQVMIHSFDNTLYQEMLSSFENVIKLGEKLRKITEELGIDPTNDHLLKQYGSLENEFLALGGYDYEYKIDMMISKFGFSKEDYDRKIGTFSGGERNKIAFTRLLLDNPDLLILDEPTNHLDMKTVEWLEDYLKSYQGTIILVSHDRYFIDEVCNCVLEISNKQSDYYRGNYSYYLNEKVLRYEQRLKAFNLQQQEIEHLQELIKKFKPKPTKVNFAKDREKKLQRILDNKIEAPKTSGRKIKLDLKALDDRKVRQETLQDLVFGYDHPLGSPVSLVVYGGDKIGIIGDNGIGKTTLLKTIGHLLKPLGGKITEHRELQIGYIDQNQIQIDSTDTVFDYIHNLFPRMTNFDVRHHLGSFLFTNDDVFKTVNQLSGGEKVRLSFAKLLLKKYDILLLDEPTNHMDIETRKVLESTLIEYPGTIIFVSHDRYFIDELATKLVIITESKVEVFKGDYLQYQEHLKGENKEIEQEVISVKKMEKKPKKVKKVSKEKLEADMTSLQEDIETMKELMFEEEYYTDQQKMAELEDNISTSYNELKHLEEEYLSILEDNEE